MAEPHPAEVAKLVYGGGSPPVFAAVPFDARRVLDVGCGDGSFGAAIKARQPVEVVGLTYSASEAALAASRLNRVVQCDLNAFESADLGLFDCVVCSHVLEHLYWPEEFLRLIRPLIAPGGQLVVALPNVLAWRQRLAFLRGRFRYTDGGLMDRTHFRFFDWRTSQELVQNAGYQILTAVGDGVFPLAKFLPGVGHFVSRAAVRLTPGLFSWQFVIVATPTT